MVTDNYFIYKIELHLKTPEDGYVEEFVEDFGFLPFENPIHKGERLEVKAGKEKEQKNFLLGEVTNITHAFLPEDPDNNSESVAIIRREVSKKEYESLKRLNLYIAEEANRLSFQKR